MQSKTKEEIIHRTFLRSNVKMSELNDEEKDLILLYRMCKHKTDMNSILFSIEKE